MTQGRRFMTRITSSLAALAILLALGMSSAPVHAQLARTFVSAASGNDANDCNRLTPCRTFQAAHDKTLSIGEITVLDAGGYGAVTITKPISIINDGVGEAGVLVSGGANGITIAASALDAISLRGLTIKGIGFGGGNGIVFNSGKSLTVEHCAIRNLTGFGSTGDGIVFQSNTSGNLAVSNTLVSDNANNGIVVAPTTNATLKAQFTRIEVYNNGVHGIIVSGGTGTINATLADSVSSNNGATGIGVGTGGGAASLMVVRSVAANNGIGIAAVQGANVTLRVSASTVTGNTTSWVTGGGAILRSYGDNNIDGNGDANPAPPLIVMK